MIGVPLTPVATVPRNVYAEKSEVAGVASKFGQARRTNSFEAAALSELRAILVRRVVVPRKRGNTINVHALAQACCFWYGIRWVPVEIDAVTVNAFRMSLRRNRPLHGLHATQRPLLIC